MFRNNMDKHKVCTYGKRLLDLCETTNMRILNGRSLGDIFDKPTCYSPVGSPSLIDYAIVDSDIVKYFIF